MTHNVLGLNGKNALVMGGGRGIGEASALTLARVGCNVAVLDVDYDRAKSVGEQVDAIGVQSYAFAGDALADDVSWIVDEAESNLGPIDVLICVIGSTEFHPILETTGEQWDQEQRANLRLCFLAGKAFAAACVRDRRPGVLTFVASVSGMQAAPSHAAYGAAKAGLIHLMKSMAVEWAPHQIRVNSVAPGSIITPRQPDSEEWRERIRSSTHPMQRRGTPEEIAGPLVFLSSDLASYVTGQTLAVDGGLTIANGIAVPSSLVGKARERH